VISYGGVIKVVVIVVIRVSLNLALRTGTKEPFYCTTVGPIK